MHMGETPSMISNFCFRNAMAIDADQDADAFWEELEGSIRKSRYITINGCMKDYGHAQIVMRFIDKYKAFIDYFHTDMKAVYGRTYIRLKEVLGEDTPHTYTQLADAYTTEYYLNDCGGYDIFAQSGGKEIELRLQDVFNLIHPNPGEHILDVGCGRGELTYALSQRGAYVTGIDYSGAAIEIARKTYGEDNEYLRYVCGDIFEYEEMQRFDKIVMADVVEHIDQEILEKIFEKISRSMSGDGVLVAHTAPNNDYYTHTWPLMRENAAKLGFYLPKNPRSYYEQMMHINEQSPERLKEALEKYFPYVHVWTGSITEINSEKSKEETYRDNQIFAYACKKEDALRKVIGEIDQKPDYNRCRVEIKAEDCTWDENEMEIPVIVINKGPEYLTSRRKWPVNAAYHIYDENNELLVYDGERTVINRVIRENEREEIMMKVKIPERLAGHTSLRLCITLVAEGAFWFDCNGNNCKFITLKR